jgi:ElaB/YqjD/DUF883 family membrane-anchored ribosome-binding protein
MNYNILSNLSNKNEKDSKKEEKKSEIYQLNKVIQDFMKENKDINAAEFKQILGKAFAMYKQKKQKVQKTIYNEFYKCIRRHNIYVRKATKLIKK